MGGIRKGEREDKESVGYVYMNISHRVEQEEKVRTLNISLCIISHHQQSIPTISLLLCRIHGLAHRPNRCRS